MKKTSKLLGAAAAATLAAATAATPAQARHDDRGIDAGDIATGVAVIGGIAVLASILDGDDDRRYDRRYDRGYGGYDYGRYGYPAGGYGGYDRYGYGGEQAAVNVCTREAARYGRNVRVTDVDRDDGMIRVRGRVEVLDRNDSRWNRPDFDRERFTCHAANGRIYDFRV